MDVLVSPDFKEAPGLLYTRHRNFQGIEENTWEITNLRLQGQFCGAWSFLLKIPVLPFVCSDLF